MILSKIKKKKKAIKLNVTFYVKKENAIPQLKMNKRNRKKKVLKI
jgi:hypothetical protein